MVYWSASHGTSSPVGNSCRLNLCNKFPKLDIIISHIMKLCELTIKSPPRCGSYSKTPEGRRPRRPERILLNNSNRAGDLTADTLKFHDITL